MNVYSATATITELGEGLTEMDVRGRFFGACSLTVVVYDRDARTLDRRGVAEPIRYSPQLEAISP